MANCNFKVYQLQTLTLYFNFEFNVKLYTNLQLQSHELGTLYQQGGGGLKPKIECPNLLKCFGNKIELNWSVSPNSTNLKKEVNKISHKDVPSSEGGEGVAKLGTMSQVCTFFF